MNLKKNIIISGILISWVVMLSGCLSYDFSRRFVQQGNLIPASKIARLSVGMNKENVAIIMGTSLLSPLFSQDRWDYAYTYRRGTGAMTIRHLSLYFKQDRLVKIQS